MNGQERWSVIVSDVPDVMEITMRKHVWKIVSTGYTPEFETVMN